MTRISYDDLQIGDWIVRPSVNRIQRGAESRPLQPQSMNVLVYLAGRAGEVVSSEELLTAFWPGRYVGDDAVHRRIADLRKQLGDDARQPRYIQTVQKRGYRLLAEVRSSAAVSANAAAATDELSDRGPIPVDAVAGAGDRAGEPDSSDTSPHATGHWRRRVAVALGVLVAVTLALSLGARGYLDRQFAVALAEAAALVAEDRYQAAYQTLARWPSRQGDPRATALLDALTLPIAIVTNPPGVSVHLREQDAPADAWQSLGTSPVRGLRLPRGSYRIRLDGRVFLNAENPGPTLNSAGVAERVIELPRDPVPEDMVFVPGGRYRLGAWGFTEERDLGGYLLDRTEVTNAAYQSFVDAGGYADETLWQSLIEASGGTLSWQLIRERFVDSTGRPGPAGWELGSYAPGSGEQPVTGISWFEAAAFLAARDKQLPSASHWLRAALGPMEWKYPFAAQLVPRSNVAGTSLEPVASRPGSEVHGAYDLIGNAREWTAGHNGALRIVMGASFRDPAWGYSFPVGLDPLTRDADLGFRGMRVTAQSLPVADERVDLFNDFKAPVRKVSDEVFAGMSFQYAYQPGQIKAEDVQVLDEVPQGHWTRRRILVPTGREQDPLPVYLYLPVRGEAPYQSVFYMPPADSWAPGFRSESVRLEDYQLDFVPRSGRVLVWPVYSGSHERYDGFHAVPGPERAKLALERNRRVRDEIGRVLDYLDDEPLFDGARVAIIGLSHGAIMTSYPLALEPRLKAAVLYSVGIAPPNPVFGNPQNDPNLFWARVTQPVLVVNGRYDPIRPHQLIMEPFLALLATPPADKKGVLLEAAHWPLPRHPLMRETLDWLDRYLGPTGISPASAP
ncbi:MAG: SUMF1/EgtB/PvdO family nonheme iron enzyme [Pseudomonadales bacterium]